MSSTMTRQLSTLRPRQVRAMDLLRGSIGNGKRRPTMMAPTGFGKTHLAVHMTSGALKKGNRVSIVVPQLSLIDQTFERFLENGIHPGDMGIVQANHPHRRAHAPIQICSVQTLQRRQDFPDSTFVIVDENHVRYDAISRWMAQDPKRIFVGLSATPWRPGMGLEWDDLLIPATIQQLIDEGDLCKFRAFAPAHPDLTGIGTVAGDYNQGQLADRMQQPQLVADVVKNWLEKGENRPTFVFAVDRAHAASLQAEFAGVGVSTAYVDGETEREERQAIEKAFHQGEFRVVVSVGTMTTGIDWDVRCIVLACPTKSEIKYVQIFGRGLRNAPGKDHLLFFDHSNTSNTLGLPTDIHHDEFVGGKAPGEKRAASERKPKTPLECSKCGYLLPRGLNICEECGYVIERRSHVTVDDEQELVEWGTKAQAKANRTYSTADKRAFFGGLLMQAERTGKKRGWAAYSYKEKFGVWPNAHGDVSPCEPTIEVLAWIRHRNIAMAKSHRKASGAARDARTLDMQELARD